MRKIWRIFYRLFIRHLDIKIISLLLASAIWYYINNKINIERKLNINIDLLTDEPNVYIENKEQYKVEMTLKGPKEILSQIKSDDILAEIKFKTNKQKIIKISLQETDFQLPKNLTIIKFYPQTFYVQVDFKVSKEINVVPIYNKIFFNQNSFEITGISPEKIKIYGPSKILKNIKTLNTNMISNQELKHTNDFIYKKLFIPDKNITLDYPYVLVYIKKQIEQSINIESNNVYILSKKKESFIATKVFAKLVGPKEQLEQLTKNNNFIFFINKINKKTSYPIEFFSPYDGIKIKEIIPEAIIDEN